MSYFQTLHIDQVLLFNRYQTIREVLNSNRASFVPLQCFITRLVLHSSVGFLHQCMLFIASIFQQPMSFQFYLEIQLPSHSVLLAVYQEIYFFSSCSLNMFFLFLVLAVCHTIYVRKTVLSATSVFSMVDEFKICMPYFQKISCVSVVANIWKLLT